MGVSPYFQYLQQVIEGAQFKIEETVIRLIECIERESHIWIVGNGGSASTSEHFETDLSFVRHGYDFPKVCATALTSNSSLISAIANDIGFEKVFSHQIARKAKKGDLCFMISASGNSANLINAAITCRNLGIDSICLVGFDGGELIKVVDCSILITTEVGKYGPVEDIHLAICHEISSIIASKLIKV